MPRPAGGSTGWRRASAPPSARRWPACSAALCWIGGSARQWADELSGAVLEHGASGFMPFSPQGGTPDALSLARWAREIVPAVREAIGCVR